MCTATHGRRIFSSNVVKHAEKSHGNCKYYATENLAYECSANVMNDLLGGDENGMPWSFVTLKKGTRWTRKFKLFEIVKRTSVPVGSRIY